MKVRKKPVEAEAVLWDGANLTEIRSFVGKYLIEVALNNKTRYTRRVYGNIYRRFYNQRGRGRVLSVQARYF